RVARGERVVAGAHRDGLDFGDRLLLELEPHRERDVHRSLGNDGLRRHHARLGVERALRVLDLAGALPKTRRPELELLSVLRELHGVRERQRRGIARGERLEVGLERALQELPRAAGTGAAAASAAIGATAAVARARSGSAARVAAVAAFRGAARAAARRAARTAFRGAARAAVRGAARTARGVSAH